MGEMDEGWIIAGLKRNGIHYFVGRKSLCGKWHMLRLFASGKHPNELSDSHHYQDGESGVIHEMYFPDKTMPLIPENICKKCLAKMTDSQKKEIRQLKKP